MSLCKRCNKQIPPERAKFPRVVYCSNYCNKRFSYEKIVKPTQHKRVEVDCVICKKHFMPDIFHPKTETCSNGKCQSRNDLIKHREKRMKIQKIWKNANKEKNYIYSKTYRTKHREKYNAMKKARNHKLKKEEWVDICEKHGNMCALCEKGGNYMTLSVDHIIPLARGGEKKWWNIQPLCLLCNQKKGDRFIG